MLVLEWWYSVLILYLCGLFLFRASFDRKRDSIAHRIHVNGIRGKSTVTRYVAAILREGGLRTFGKTTGTAARVILPDGKDSVIRRRGYPNVSEQLAMMKSFANRGAEAAVVECMAVNPDYQEWLEDKVMHSHIGIITNVRIDHQEEMGHGLLAIAKSISKTIPRDGILITSESNPDVLQILRQECEMKHTQLIEAPVSKVTDAEIKCFSYVAHKENVAIGLAVAKLYGIKPGKAMRAMVNTRPDPGAFEVETIPYKGKIIKWANLFAVNDKESFAEISSWLAKDYDPYHRIAILNNRQDRPSRVEMFCRLALHKLAAGTVVAFGDYERRVEKFMEDKEIGVMALGNTSESSHLSGEELFDTIVMATPASEILLVGAVNIHTPQAERLLEYIADLTGAHGAEHELARYKTRRSALSGYRLKLQKRLALSMRYLTARRKEI